MAPRFPDMPSTVSTTSISGRRPLAEFNGRQGDGILRSIPEGKKADPLSNVSRAVCVKDGIGHDVAEDPCMEAENGKQNCYLFLHSGKKCSVATSIDFFSLYATSFKFAIDNSSL